MNQESRPDRKVAAAERQEAALRLRRDGMEYADIARRLNYSGKSGAWKAVATALKKHVAENVDALRIVEGMRLDALQSAVWEAALGGDVAAVRAALAVSERRSKLYGLDAPARTSVDVWQPEIDFSKLTDEELRQIIDGGDGNGL